MHSPSSSLPIMEEESAEAAKRRIAQEMANIQATTNQKRIQNMKQLVGEEASPIKDRKGTYQQRLEDFANKGKEYLKNEDGTFMEDLPLTSSSSSPIKEYKALAAANAEKAAASSIPPPSLFAHDPVQEANDQVAAAMKVKAAASSPAVPSTPNPLTPKDWDGVTFYTLVQLRQRQVPKESIDWKNREQYLSDEDFFRAFSMTKHDFAAQPKWKRDKLKQGLYLF